MGTLRRGVYSPAQAFPGPFPPPPSPPPGDTGSLFIWEESSPLVSRNSWALSPQLWLNACLGLHNPGCVLGNQGPTEASWPRAGSCRGPGSVRLEAGPRGPVPPGHLLSPTAPPTGHTWAEGEALSLLKGMLEACSFLTGLLALRGCEQQMKAAMDSLSFLSPPLSLRLPVGWELIHREERRGTVRNSWVRGRFPAWASRVVFISGHSTLSSKGLGSSSHCVVVKGRSFHISCHPACLISLSNAGLLGWSQL